MDLVILATGLDAYHNWQDNPVLQNLVSFGFVALIVFVVVWTIIVPALSKMRFRGPTLAGTAQVLAVKSTGTVVNNTGYECKIALRVEVPGRETYDVTVKQVLDVAAMPAIQPGTTVPVRVLAAHPRRVRINFDQPVTQQAGSSRSHYGAQLDQLSKLADLHDRGVLTDAEFEAEKRKLLGE